MTKPYAILCLIFALFLSIPMVAVAEEASVAIIKGMIIDEATKKPIEGAVVSSDVGISPVQSGEDGRFKFILLSGRPFKIYISKEGYGSFERLLTPQNTVTLDVRLKRQDLKIEFEDFKKGSHLKGRVIGLSANETSKYKVVVYVLTDKWYIHPFAENKEGRGYAKIGEDGAWSIKSVWRGYQAYKVAFLLTQKTQFTPSTVNAAMPEQDLLASVPHKDSLFIEAPDGI